MKNIYFIRHGQSEANMDYDLLYLKADEDIELTDQGKLDAIQAGHVMEKHLKDLKPESVIILVSPYKRTRQTFERLAAVAGINDPGVSYAVDIVDEIVEHKMNLVGHPENFNKFKEYENSGWKPSNHMEVRYDGGESLSEVRERAKQFLVDCAVCEDYENIVVVSHGLFIKMALSLIDGTDPDSITHPKNGEIIIRKIESMKASE